MIADLSTTSKEIAVGSFRAHSEYHRLPTRRRYGGPTLAFVTPVSEAQFGLHDLGADLPHTAFTRTDCWLCMDKPEEFDRILDEFLARVRVAGAPRSREPRK